MQNLVARKGVPTKGMDVIEEGHGGEKGRERVYFWIDADAVFVNFEKRLEELVRGHSHKGMIISREGGGGTMANTGTFFLRENYRWGAGKDAGAFLKAWWNVGSSDAHLRHGGRHEQQALDVLAEREEWVRNGIQLEPTERINSIPPFYATTNKDSFIMHLMYEPYGQLRELVFQAVYEVRFDHHHGLALKKMWAWCIVANAHPRVEPMAWAVRGRAPCLCGENRRKPLDCSSHHLSGVEIARALQCALMIAPDCTHCHSSLIAPTATRV